ncbi:MAG: hypothetical protein WAQ24_05330 [Candidatus Saccharimonadales bacterium]
MKISVVAHTKWIWVAMAPGAVVVALETLLRFARQPLVYDTVGQQVLSEQLLRGTADGGYIGATHYFLKMFLVYIPFDLLRISPRLGLILMTILVNVVSFLGIVLLAQRLLAVFKTIPQRHNSKTLNQKKFYISLGLTSLLFAVFYSSLFWIQFANSRNLEVVGAFAVMVLGVEYLQKQTFKRAVVLGILLLLLAFSDTLLFACSVVSLLLFGVALALHQMWRVKNWIISKRFLIPIVVLIGTAAGAYAVGVLLLRVAQQVTGISILSAPINPQPFTLMTAKTIMVAFVRLFTNAWAPYHLVQLAAIGVVALIVCLFFYGTMQSHRRLMLLVLIGSAVTVCLYGASGQVLNGDTSRYLIFLVPLFVVMSMVAVERVFSWKYPLVLGILCGISIIGVGFLYYAPSLIANKPQQMRSQYGLVQALPGANIAMVYASMDTSLPLSYLSRGTTAALPVACKDARLLRGYLFYGARQYTNHEAAMRLRPQVVLLVDPGGNIANATQVCNEAAIQTQFGMPTHRQPVAGGYVALFFETQDFQRHLLPNDVQPTKPNNESLLAR